MESDEIRLGNYRTLVELASGGMGTLYVARQAGAGGFERLVVIKRVHKHLLKSREFCDMFRDEARVASLVRHPNVVSVDDVVEGDGELFLVQPYVESVTLAELASAAQARGERLAPKIVARVVADALLGLEHAHEAVDLKGEPLRLVHRDVSPQNVLVGTDGVARIIDFGIAKAESRATVTSSGVLKGKLPYMAPEQFKKLPIDRRTDVFAAGVVLYEALTGKRPFEGADEGDTLLSILLGEPDAPSAVAPEVPEPLDRVVAKALERERDDRFPTASAFREELEKALALASHKDVAGELARLTGDAIEERRAIVRARLEGQNAVEALERAAPEPIRDEPSASTIATVVERKTGRDRRASRGLAVAIGVVAALAGVALAIGFTSKGPASAPPRVAESAPIATASAPAIEALAVVLTAESEIESVRAPGLRRVELDGATARLALAPWSKPVVVEAALRGGGAARATLEPGATSAHLEAVVAPLPARASAVAVHAPAASAVPRPSAATSAPALHGNPYGTP